MKDGIRYSELKLGGKTRHGNLIKYIFRRENKFIICTVEWPTKKRIKEKLWIDYDEDLRTAHRRKGLDKFKKLRDIALFSLKGDQLKWAYGLLSTAVANCFIADEDENLDDCFEEASRYIEGNSKESIRSKYLIYTMITVIPAIILMSLAYFRIPETPEYYRVLALAMISGAVGALFSILIGGRLQQIDPFVLPCYLVIDSIARALIGMISAFVIILASLGDFAFTIAKDNVYLQCLFSIGAGFSERLAPELFGRIMKKELKSESQK